MTSEQGVQEFFGPDAQEVLRDFNLAQPLGKMCSFVPLSVQSLFQFRSGPVAEKVSKNAGPGNQAFFHIQMAFNISPCCTQAFGKVILGR